MQSDHTSNTIQPQIPTFLEVDHISETKKKAPFNRVLLLERALHYVTLLQSKINEWESLDLLEFPTSENDIVLMKNGI